MKFTIRQFIDRFPTSDSCLEEIKQLRYANFVCPKCARENMLSKISGRPQYVCPCGYQVAPLADTIFHKSSTDLRTWFYAMYIMTQTRAGISAKQLERETGVTYKTAWRMFKQIRSLMDENGGDLLKGVVEIDEAYIGGVRKGRVGRAANSKKGLVLGMVERQGRIRTKVVKHDGGRQLLPQILENISMDADVVSDKLGTYCALAPMGYEHRSVNHSKREYVMGNVHINTIEGFWGNLKKGIQGVYRHVEVQYLQSYTNEYAWRYSNRKSEVPMFELLLKRI